MTLRVPAPTVTAPDWQDNPYEWCMWYLTENQRVYREFRRVLDQRFARYPEAKMSADAALHVVRFNTHVNARGDMFQINNNASALFARLYTFERPQYKGNFELRKSWLDDLDPAAKWRLANAAKGIKDEPAQAALFGGRA